MHAQTFWEHLSQAGRRVGLIDVPRVRLARELNGFQIVDWCGHDPSYPTSLSSPPGLMEEVIQRYGRNPVPTCDIFHRDAGDYRALVRSLCARAQTKASLCQELLEREKPDFFGVVFAESHCVGHQGWHLHDPTYPTHDPELAAAVGPDPMLEVYRAIDAAVGMLLQQIPSECHVAVLASHGMAGHYDAEFLLEDILRKLEGSRSTVGTRLFETARELWRHMPQFVHRAFPSLERHKHSVRARLLEEDRRRRRFFLVPNNEMHPGIQINLAGREPNGLVSAAEFESVRESLRRDLLEIVNTRTGRPMLTDVLFPPDHYNGPRLDRLPDLVLEWNIEAPIHEVTSPRIGRVVGHETGTRTGNHRPEGLLMWQGPGVASGPLGRSVSTQDLAPTFCALLGAPMPGVEGDAIPEIVESSTEAGAPAMAQRL
jgi:predicted AlkP superfamily phosphohydrolase/phosphomutase